MDRISLFVALAAALVGCGTSVSGDGSGGGGDAGGPPGDGATTTTGGGGGAGGGDAGPYPLDCAALPRCAETDVDELTTECPDDTWCIFYPGCLTPVCLSPEEACAARCGGPCEILTSRPAEMDICFDGGGPAVDGMDALTCEDLQAELDVIQACTEADQCGRVLPGTSCGCTRDLVARNDVPVDVFEAMLEATADQGCFGSTCDCPETDGFACVDGRCTWSYVDGP